MILNHHELLLAMGSSGGAQGQSTAPFFMQMVPMIVMVGIFYMVFIRPQQTKAKEHEKLLKTLKKGDRVFTTSGIIGTVITVKEKSVSIRSDESKFEILKSAVAEVTDRGGDTNET